MQPFKHLSINYNTIIQGLKPLLYIEADVSFSRKGKPVVIWRGKKSILKNAGVTPLFLYCAPRTKAFNIHLHPPEAALTLIPAFISLSGVRGRPAMDSYIYPAHVITPCTSIKKSSNNKNCNRNNIPPKILLECVPLCVDVRVHMYVQQKVPIAFQGRWAL